MVFKVVVRGNPFPSLTWYFQDTPLESDYNMEIKPDGSLNITSTELKNNGIYKLLAKNAIGSVEKEVKLTVAPEEEEVKPPQSDKIYMKPIPMDNFGDYVVQCHSNSNEIFKLQYAVSLYQS